MTGGVDMKGGGVTGARELLVIAVGAALEAGQLLASKEGRVEVAATKSSPTDVVTEMDGRAEELIRARILVARPDDAILGEEGGQVEGAADAPARWVVDPLDGTVNYLYGLHDWAVSIAAEVDPPDRGGRGLRADAGRAVHRRPRRGRVAGVHPRAGNGGRGGRVRHPRFDLRADSAPVPARGAARPGADRDRIRVPGAAADRAGRGGGRAAARIRDIRRNGVASADLCAVAAGRVDGYYERGLNYWDYAAGALIAAEAGAVVGDSKDGPPSPSMAVAAGPGLFGPLRDALAELDAERDG